mmetsp:Transcript_124896/g.347742  ORF Transcript_124896/g.347742 Transcript_124896/m.347742 type:complete len:367 (-) Transcript_124896:122-1222(-)
METAPASAPDDVAPAELFEIAVRSTSGVEDIVSVERSATVQDLRLAVERRFQMGALSYGLLADGVPLDPLDAKLSDLGLQTGSAVTIAREHARDYTKVTGFERTWECDRYPNGVLFDQRSGRLFVCHYYGHLEVYDPDYAKACAVKLPASAPSQMAMSADGELLIAFRGGGMVGAFDAERGTLNRWICKGTGRPSGLAVFKDRVFVSDSTSKAVLVLRLGDGELVQILGSTLGLAYPSGLAVVEDRLLAVADRGANKVFLVSLNSLELVGQLPGIDAEGRPQPAQARLQEPNDITVDPCGNLLVMDVGGERIVVFRQDGTLLASVMEGFFKDHGNTFSYLACNHSTGAIAVSNNDEHTISVLAPPV